MCHKIIFNYFHLSNAFYCIIFYNFFTLLSIIYIFYFLLFFWQFLLTFISIKKHISARRWDVFIKQSMATTYLWLPISFLLYHKFIFCKYFLTNFIFSQFLQLILSCRLLVFHSHCLLLLVILYQLFFEHRLFLCFLTYLLPIILCSLALG